MTDSSYRLYENDTIKLARSLVIKCEATADAINRGLRELKVDVLENDPYSWKYYLNLNGEYHSTDVPMEITSMDTLEPIIFNKANLAIHKTTRALYSVGTQYYKALMGRYPEQRDLIHGILDPVELATAVRAKDFEILNYNSSLVEPQETNLISELQDWIFANTGRWYDRDFELTHDLYTAGYLTIAAHIIPLLLNIRLSNCHTMRAHSFHIWAYLRGKQRLDRFKRSMTLKQALFLYRNIRYIQKNVGKTSTFNLLVDRLLTERQISLYGYNLRHNLENQPESLRPEVEVIRQPINDIDGKESDEVYTVLDVLQKTALMAVDNPVNMGEKAAQIEAEFKDSPVNEIPTKTLESVLIATSTVIEISIEDILAIDWLQLAHKKYFIANLLIPNPHTGDVLQLNPLDAYILYVYAYNLSLGNKLGVIPNVIGGKLLKDPLPSIAELKGIVESRFWDDRFGDLLDALPKENRIINNVDFYDYCERHLKVMVRLNDIHKHHRRLHGQAQWRNLEAGLMHRQVFELNKEAETFDEWLFLKEIDLEDMSKEDAHTLAKNIVTAVTGIDDSTAITPRIIQSDLVDILDELTSYDLQFVKTVIDSDSFLINANAVRHDNVKADGGDRRFIDVRDALSNLKFTHVPNTHYCGTKMLYLKDWSGSKNLFHTPNVVNVRVTNDFQTYRYHAPLANIAFKERNNDG